jgi:pseudouridine synthase
MRLNQYIAAATGLSRRAADQAIQAGRVHVNDQLPSLGQRITADDRVTLDSVAITPAIKTTTILLHKPVGYVCSRNGQGNATIYDLLPIEYRALKPVGRLDKDSSGLLVLTNDGKLAHTLTHPSFQKDKVYEVTLDKPLTEADMTHALQGVKLDDGLSTFDHIEALTPNTYRVVLHQGRNRQIRRTFAALGYMVTRLHRTRLGTYELGSLQPAQIAKLP